MLTCRSIRRDAGTDWYEEASGDTGLWTLVLVHYGKCVYWLNREKHILEKGSLLLIPDRVPYYGKSVPNHFHEKYAVQFQPSASESLPLPLLAKQEYTLWKTGRFELLADRFRTMYGQWEEQFPYYETMCGALLLEALTHMSREIDSGTLSPVKHRHAELMKSYIQNHYREKVTKEQLGRHIEKSPNYAAALFHEVTGQTISDFVHALRVKTAMYMLRDSQLTAGEISEFVGYNDPSYFYRVFKRITGSLPSEFTKEREKL